MRATPRYYVESTCYPSPQRGNVVERVNVEFEYAEGGCNGSGVTFTFHDFSNSFGRSRVGMEVSGWGDGMQNLLDARILKVLRGVREAQRRAELKAGGYSDGVATPERVVQLLERVGIPPSAKQKEMSAR